MGVYYTLSPPIHRTKKRYFTPCAGKKIRYFTLCTGKKIHDSLAGRKKIFQLFTCSFDEYLKLKNKEELIDEIRHIQDNLSAKSTQIETLQQEWCHFMIYGGYPAVITEHDMNDIFFWRTTLGNEIDFVLSHIENPYAVEVKYNSNAVSLSKCKLFRTTYPDIPVRFAWMEPFEEVFFREEVMRCLTDV